jgi:hypothetical protein
MLDTNVLVDQALISELGAKRSDHIDCPIDDNQRVDLPRGHCRPRTSRSGGELFPKPVEYIRQSLIAPTQPSAEEIGNSPATPTYTSSIALSDNLWDEAESSLKSQERSTHFINGRIVAILQNDELQVHTHTHTGGGGS